jgi:hypothetical protein
MALPSIHRDRSAPADAHKWAKGQPIHLLWCAGKLGIFFL